MSQYNALMVISTATDALPLTEIISPADQAELAAAMREAHARETPVYPIGGGTSLEYGVIATKPGLGLCLSRLNRVVDFPARDMTITAEAGITMAALADALAAERMRLPIDVPRPTAATLGGVIATNTSGPGRYGHGTMRDYVIGVNAVDGRGGPFKGGGRVVKNVAGYDFCKLLTGSLGTLGIITQVTLKVKPIAEAHSLMACELATWEQAESRLAGMADSRTMPAAIELLVGPAWHDDPALGADCASAAAVLVVGLEGNRVDVDWMVETLRKEWNEQGVRASRVVPAEGSCNLWNRLTEFPATVDSPLVVKSSVLPSTVIGLIRQVLEHDPKCSILAHAGNGIVMAAFKRNPSRQTSEEAERLIREHLQPAAARAGGSLVVLSAANRDLSRQAVWGPRSAATVVMEAVKKQFDPKGLLNPGRFVYGHE